MYNPLELKNVNGGIEIINLSQVVKTFDNQTDDHGTVLIIQHSNGDNTVVKGNQREFFISIENVHKEGVKMTAWHLAQQIEATAAAAREQEAQNAQKPPKT